MEGEPSAYYRESETSPALDSKDAWASGFMQFNPDPLGTGHLPVETCPKGAVDKKVGLKSYEP